MATTTYQKRLNQVGQPNIPKTRTKKTISQPPSKIKTNDPKDIKIRYYFSFINIYK
jgi:hypothetical protein